MSETPEVTITISSRLELAAQAMRQAALVASGALTLAGYLRHRDLDAILTWMQSDALLPFMMGAVTLAIAAYGWVRTLLNKAKLVRVASALPSTVAFK